MKYVKLGKTDMEVSAIGLGCMVIAGFYNPGSADDAVNLIRHAGDIGVNFLDSSDAYGAGKNEEILARALDGRRDDFIVSTKFGNVRGPDGKPGADGRPEHVIKACDKSLQRLKIDVIDLYYQHRVDPTVPIEDTVGAMARLVEQGKVKHLGLSEAAPETVRRAHATAPISALQHEYSLWTRDEETDLIPLCKELGITYVAYSPLGRGIFGGGITGADSLADGDRRRDHPRFKAENLDTNLRLLEPVKALAAAKGATPAQIALSWMMSKHDHVIPIPGTRKIENLDANAAAVEVSLSADEVATLDQAIPPGAAEGTRYPPGGMKTVRL
ncbi:MAG: aldo/keto reductase [Rhodospirillaceae bacterium]